MRILYIALFNTSSTTKPLICSEIENLSQFWFFQRNTIREVIRFSSREILRRIQPNTFSSVKHKINEQEEIEYTIHVNNNQQTSIGYTVLTDSLYPSKVAHRLGQSCVENLLKKTSLKEIHSFSEDTQIQIPSMFDDLEKFQTPEKVDKITMINQQINETKEILEMDIKKLLKNNEKLEDLLAKTEGM